MDFWSRLIAGGQPSGSVPSSPRQQPSDRSGDMQLFTKASKYIMQSWRENQLQPYDVLARAIHMLSHKIREESGRSGSYPCLNKARKEGLHVLASKVAIKTQDEDVIREVIDLYSSIVDSDDKSLLADELFARTVCACLSEAVYREDANLNPEVLKNAASLMYHAATHIRLQPRILDAWFQPPNEQAGATPDEPSDEFPLFYLLLDQVHQNGEIGEYARLGLLYIVESADKSITLEKWILDSDLGPRTATACGAFYSQLGAGAPPLRSRAELPPIFRFSPELAQSPGSYNPSRTADLEIFISYLAFFQDILDYCKSPKIEDSLLADFEKFFVKQILYPSLLESSDESGSLAAVLTYLHKILAVATNHRLAEDILTFLLSSSASVPSQEVPSKSVRETADLQYLPPDLYSLRDLIADSLASGKEQTVVSALIVLDVLLDEHHTLPAVGAIMTAPIVRVERTPSHNVPTRRPDVLYLSSGLGTDERGIANIVSAYRSDMWTRHRRHNCGARLPALQKEMQSPEAYLSTLHQTGLTRDASIYRLDLGDSIAEHLMQHTRRFLTNTVEANLRLTSIWTTLVCCEQIARTGWITTSSTEDIDQQLGGQQLPNFAGESNEKHDSTSSYESSQARIRQSNLREPRFFRILAEVSNEARETLASIAQSDRLVEYIARLAGRPLESLPKEARETATTSATEDRKVGQPKPLTTLLTESLSPSRSPSRTGKNHEASLTATAEPSDHFDADAHALDHSITRILLKRISFPSQNSHKSPRPSLYTIGHLMTNIVLLRHFIVELSIALEIRQISEASWVTCSVP